MFLSQSPLRGGHTDWLALPHLNKASGGCEASSRLPFSAQEFIGLLMELNFTKTGFRHLSDFMTRRGRDCTAPTGHIFQRPVPTRQAFLDTRKNRVKPLELRPPGFSPPIHGSRHEAGNIGAQDGQTGQQSSMCSCVCVCVCVCFYTSGTTSAGHEATETGLAYAPVSQAHGHNHISECLFFFGVFLSMLARAAGP